MAIASSKQIVAPRRTKARAVPIGAKLHGTHWPIEEALGTEPPPQQVVVREIDIAPASPCPFFFNKPDKAHPIANLNGIIQSLRDKNYQYNEPVHQYFRPLDIRLIVPTCFVFYLSDKWNWRFTHLTRAATLSSSDPDIRKNYTGLRHVLDTNGGTIDPHPHDKFCKIIFFNAAPPVVPLPPATTFKHPFNLIIEFTCPDGDDPTRQNVIPVVIDPDIRNPGGSEP